MASPLQACVGDAGNAIAAACIATGTNPMQCFSNALNSVVQCMYSTQYSLPQIQSGNSCTNGGTIDKILLNCNSGCSEQDTQGACPVGDDGDARFVIVKLQVPSAYLSQAFVAEFASIFPQYLSNSYANKPGFAFPTIRVSTDSDLSAASSDLFYQIPGSNPNLFPTTGYTPPSYVGDSWCSSGVYNPNGDGVTFAYGWPWNNENTEGCGAGPGLQKWPSVNGDNSMSANGEYNSNVHGIFITVQTGDSVENVVNNFQWALNQFSNTSGGSFYTNAVSAIVPIYSGAFWQTCDNHGCPNMQSVSRSCTYQDMMVMFGLNKLKNFQNMNLSVKLLLPKLYLWLPLNNIVNPSDFQNVVEYNIQNNAGYTNSNVTTSDELIELIQANSSATTWNGAWCNCGVYFDGTNYQVGYPSNAGSIQGCGQGYVGIAGCGPFGSTTYGGIWYTVNSFDSPSTVVSKVSSAIGGNVTQIFYIPNFTNLVDSNFSFTFQFEATGPSVDMILDICTDSPVLPSCTDTDLTLYSPSLIFDAVVNVYCSGINSITIQNIDITNVSAVVGNVDVGNGCNWLANIGSLDPSLVNLTESVNGSLNSSLGSFISSIADQLNGPVLPYTFVNNTIPVGLVCDAVTWLLWLSAGGADVNLSSESAMLKRIKARKGHEKRKTAFSLTDGWGVRPSTSFVKSRHSMFADLY